MRKPHTYWDEGITIVSSCTKCSPGCDNCWALAMEERFKPEFKGQVQFHPDRLSRFNTRKPKVFSLWNDLYHKDVPDSFRHKVYAHCRLNDRHTFLILSKRPSGMSDFLMQYHYDEIIPCHPNIWHGLTVCNQQEADEKIPIFMQVPGKKFLSIEPMLEKIDLSHYLWFDGTNEEWFDSYSGGYKGKPEPCYDPQSPFDAVILGGETGAKARPMNLDWARSIAEQCKAAGVPLFTKALTINGKPNHDILDWPAELRIRELAW